MTGVKTLIGFSVAALLTAGVATAQPRPDKSWKNWFGHIDASYTIPQGDAGDVLDDGYSISGGASYQPEGSKLGLVLDLDYTELDISNSAIAAINDAIDDTGDDGRLTGGDMTIWSLTVNGTWSPSTSGQGFYVIAGIGAYNYKAQVTETGLIAYPPICDPWFWWCVPGGVGTGAINAGSDSGTEFGWNAGLGWAFQVGGGSQIFIETRFHSVDTSPLATDYLPLTIGYRW